MKIATIGLPHHGAAELSISQLSFMRPETLRDVDTVVWNVQELLPELESELEQHEPKVLSVRGSEVLLATSRHWRQEFSDLLLKGGSLVVLIPPCVDMGIHTLQEIMPYDLLEPLPSAQLKAGSGTPSRPVCTAGEPFRTLFEEIGPLLGPTVVLDSYPGTPILHDTESQVLACYHAQTPGRVIFLPSLNPTAWEHNELFQAFFASVQRCIERFGLATGVSNAKWLSRYTLTSEKSLFEEHSECIRQLGALQQRIRTIEATISQEDFFKQMMAGTGSGVYIAVAQAFRAKGAFVQADWITSSMVLVELTDRYLAVQIRLPDEAIDPPFLQHLHGAKERIETYFSKPVTVLVVDCWQNNLALPERKPLLAEYELVREHGFLYMEGLSLYGWHMDADDQGADMLTQHLQQHGPTYLEQLASIITKSLQPSHAPSPHLMTSAVSEALPRSEIFER